MTQFQNCSNVFVKETTDHTDYLERPRRNQIIDIEPLMDTERHEILTTDRTDYTDNTINASQTSAEVLKVLNGRNMMDC